MKLQPLNKPPNDSARIAPLSVLPIFVNLNGRDTIVIGDSAAALWKAELLLQAGARVRLLCQVPPLTALQLAGRAQALTLELGAWQDMPFTAAAMVIADVPESEINAVSVKAVAAGALFNAIDKPAFCQFQFGAIVNRSPVVIGISTGGAAPVLAQMLRGLIESALPAAVQGLAAKAERLRGRINARLLSGESRRAYWNAFFARLHFVHAAPSLTDAPYRIEKSEVEELSLRDLRALRQAETLCFAKGANLKIGEFARREAARHHNCSAASLPPPGRGLVLVGKF